MAQTVTAAASAEVHPKYEERFRPHEARAIIGEVLKEKLAGVVYSSEEAGELTRDIAEDIRTRIKEALTSDRYKVMVHVILGEQRGEGVRVASRCFWDTHCDEYANDFFINAKLFCHTTVYCVWNY